MSRQIKIGDVLVGGGAPVVIQSMLNTKTTDVEGSLAQLKQLKTAGCQIARLFNGRSGSDPDIHIHFICYDHGKRCLSKAGRSVQKNVIQRLIPHLCCANEYREIFFCFFLADILVKRSRPQRRFIRIFAEH